MIPPVRGFSLDLRRATAGENLTLLLNNINGTEVIVFWNGLEISPSYRSYRQLSLRIPYNAQKGFNTLSLRQGKKTYSQKIFIYGNLQDDIDVENLVALIRAGTNLVSLETWLRLKGFQLSQAQNLGGKAACGNLLIDINIKGIPLGKALAELEANEAVLAIDPRTTYGLSDLSNALQLSQNVDYQSAIGSPLVHQRGFEGQGIQIAVLDTGVSEHPELKGRLLPGFNFVADSRDVSDHFDNPMTHVEGDGHGTAVAVFAAGSSSGIAPKAKVLPLKVCDDEGRCLASNLIKGLCYALNHQPSKTKQLILNLSLGGSYPIDSLESILRYAISQGAMVVSAAGNEGEFDSPAHYPAAFNLEGLLAIGAAEPHYQVKESCLDFSAFRVGEVYVSGDGRDVEGARLSFQSFQDLMGEYVANGRARVVGGVRAGGSSPELSLSSLNLNLTFSQSIQKLSFSLSANPQENQNFNLGFNDSIHLNQAISQLFSFQNSDLGEGITASVNLDLQKGFAKATLTGNLQSFYLGSQALIIDNICFSYLQNSNAWQISPFSTQGSYVDLVAPGSYLRGASPNGSYLSGYEGTSFATPLVAGAVALWREAYPNLSPKDLSQQMMNAANKNIFEDLDPQAIGAGMLDLSTKP